MKIDWSKQVHDGWRRSLGIFCITFAIAMAIFYFLDKPHDVTIASNGVTPSVAPSPAEATPSLPTTPGTVKSGKIHLLTATQKELESLPKIGTVKATAIIEYREKYGLKSVNDLDKVRGIGPATIELLRPLLEL